MHYVLINKLILTVGVDLIDHVLKFSFCWVLAQRSHDSAQFLGGDSAIAILVKQRKGLFEFSNLLFCKLIRLRRKNFSY